MIRRLIYAYHLEPPSSVKVIQMLVFRTGKYVDGVLAHQATEFLK
jgi:hypothetical protein